MEPIAQFNKYNPQRVINVYERATGAILAVVTYVDHKNPWDVELFYEDNLFVRKVTAELTPGGLRLPKGQACVCARTYTRIAEEVDKVALVKIAKERGLSLQIRTLLRLQEEEKLVDALIFQI